METRCEHYTEERRNDKEINKQIKDNTEPIKELRYIQRKNNTPFIRGRLII